MSKIYAARMKEFNKAKGYLRRNMIVLGRHYTAGDASKGRPFIPSPIVVISFEEAKELLRKDAKGRPIYRQPRSDFTKVFDVFAVEDPKDLLEMAQKEADQRAAKGISAARATLAGSVASVLADKPTPELEMAQAIDDDASLPEPEEQISTIEEEEDTNPLDGDLTPVDGAEEEDTEGDDESPEETEEEEAEPKAVKPKAGKSKDKKTGKKNTGRSGSSKK